jgi:hypothetical protein
MQKQNGAYLLGGSQYKSQVRQMWILQDMGKEGLTLKFTVNF